MIGQFKQCERTISNPPLNMVAANVVTADQVELHISTVAQRTVPTPVHRALVVWQLSRALRDEKVNTSA